MVLPFFVKKSGNVLHITHHMIILLISPIITHRSFLFPLHCFLILLKNVVLFFVFALLYISWRKAISYHLIPKRTLHGRPA